MVMKLTGSVISTQNPWALAFGLHDLLKLGRRKARAITTWKFRDWGHFGRLVQEWDLTGPCLTIHIYSEVFS